MSLQIAAQELASKGRNGDSMLVHMTPDEVKGLQALAMAHGGSLSVNPDTGLVEANFLKSLIPMIAGFALGPAGFGLMSAGMAGLTVGGITALSTGDLGKGIMAGLGAFGGANLGSALSSTGAEATKLASLPQGGATIAENVASSSIPSSLGGTGASTGSALADVVGTTGANQVSMAPGAQSLLQASGSAPTLMTPSQVAAAQQAALETGPFANVGAGAKDFFTSGGPSRFMNAYTTAAGGPTMAAASAIPTVSGVAEALTPQVKFASVDPEQSNYAGPYKPQQRSVRYPTNRDPSDSSEFTYFTPMNPYPGFVTAAEGGLMGLARGQYFDDEPGNDEGFAPGGFSMKDGSFVMSAREVAEIGNGSSNAGLERLSKMGAQPIRGKGDGVSDSIKANIGGSQEARVARDEAYFPPEAVKRIGKGSPKKGAKKLYSLMGAAEKARKRIPRGEDSGLHKLMTA